MMWFDGKYFPLMEFSDMNPHYVDALILASDPDGLKSVFVKRYNSTLGRIFRASIHIVH